MSKGNSGGDSKLSDVPPPVYVPINRQDEYANHLGVNHSSATVMYVLSILATFCCIPVCGIIGLVHAMIAKHEGERGNVSAHRNRLFQAKCWTGWSIALGLAIWLGFFIVLIVNATAVRYYCGTPWAMAGMDYNDTDYNANWTYSTPPYPPTPVY